MTKRKRLAIDFDEVLSETNQGFLDFLKNRGKTSFSFDELTQHNWEDIDGFELSKNEILQLWDEYILLEDDNPAVRGSKEILGGLKERFELFVITARQDKLMLQTKKWIDRHFGGIINSIEFANLYTEKHMKKSEICKKLGISCMIEDNMDNAIEIADSGLDVLLMEKPWNRSRQESHENMKKVKDWYEISYHLSGINQ